MRRTGACEDFATVALNRVLRLQPVAVPSKALARML
jgi:hypothetical protein